MSSEAEIATEESDRHEHPWRLLFVSTLLCAFLSLAFLLTVGVRFFDSEWFISACPVSATFTALFGYPVIIRYRIQNSRRFCWTVFSAAFLGAFPAWFFGLEQAGRKFPKERFDSGWNMMIFIMFLSGVFGFAVLFGMRRRAKYLLSGITNDWLLSYTTKTCIADPAGALTEIPWKVADVLQRFHPLKKRFALSFFIPTLFLDTIPEGEHCLCLQERLFLCIPRSPIFYRIDWDQVEEILERYGKFSKTPRISPLSSQAEYVRNDISWH